MPNMSRRSLHGQEMSTDHLLTHHKEDTVDHSHSNYVSKESVKYKPRTLFTNNNYNEDYEYTVSRSSTYKKITVLSKITQIFYSVYIVIFSFFYNVIQYQSSWWLWLAKKVHKFASSVMLWDTRLLRRNRRNKLPAVLMLCLLPLLFFGGELWFVLAFRNTASVL